MRATILADDGLVYVEEQPLKVDLTGLDNDIHAVQWYGGVGEIEYKADLINNTRRPNERIDDFTPFQVFVDRWMKMAQSEPQIAAATPAAASSAAPQQAMHVIAD